MPGPPRIVVLSTGGTVASQTRPGGAVPVLDGDDLVPIDLVQANLIDVTITTRAVCSVDSAAMTDTEHRLLLAALREELADPDVTGVVITHGTDTLEESAMLLDLTHDDPRPVILTGAQFPADSPRADGPANIAHALVAATDPGHRRRGVLIAFDGHVLPARGAFKTSTTATAAFDTVHHGLARPMLPVVDRPTVRVDIVTAYPGFDAHVIEAVIDSGATGLVLSALGSGNAHPSVATAVRAATARGAVVVVSTRVPSGEVIATYGGGGGAVDLVAAGGIISPWLRPPQARIMLSALLTRGVDHTGVSDFVAAGGPVS